MFKDATENFVPFLSGPIFIISTITQSVYCYATHRCLHKRVCVCARVYFIPWECPVHPCTRICSTRRTRITLVHAPTVGCPSVVRSPPCYKRERTTHRRRRILLVTDPLQDENLSLLPPTPHPPTHVRMISPRGTGRKIQTVRLENVTLKHVTQRDLRVTDPPVGRNAWF